MYPPFESDRFEVLASDGLKLVAERHGHPGGPEIVLVHGLGQSRLSWAKQTHGSLATAGNIVVYDLRGHGDSSKPSSTSAYDDPTLWADDLHAVIKASGFKRPTLVGWSLGVLVIGHYIKRYGAAGIEGINAVGAVTSLDADLQGPVPLIYRERLSSPDLAVRSDAIAGFLAACFAIPPTEAEFRRMLVFNGMVPPEMQTGVMAIGQDNLDDAWGAAPRILATWGDEDRHVKMEMSRRFLDLNPNARLSIYEGTAHAPFYDRPERFNRELLAFAAGQ